MIKAIKKGEGLGQTKEHGPNRSIPMRPTEALKERKEKPEKGFTSPKTEMKNLSQLLANMRRSPKLEACAREKILKGQADAIE